MKTFKKILGRAIPGIFVRKYHHYKVQQKFRGGVLTELKLMMLQCQYCWEDTYI